LLEIAEHTELEFWGLKITCKQCYIICFCVTWTHRTPCDVRIIFFIVWYIYRVVWRIESCNFLVYYLFNCLNILS